ncbi:MAG: hypothetical protein K6E20_03605 [Acholeplasmatales bacterium]|nr:hypothetical protein [Acholeplasmatales bacterium]
MDLKKKRILKAVLFSLISLGLFTYSLFLYVPRKLKPSEATRFYRGEGYKDEPKDSLDAVIIGSSDAFACFSPTYIYENYGLRTYNCGVSKQSVLGMRKQLESVFEYQSPKAVIVETDAIYYKNYSETEYLFVKAKDFVTKYHLFWKDLTFENFYAVPNYPKDPLRGFIFRKQVTVPERFRDDYYHADRTVKGEPFDKGVKSNLNKIVDLCEKNNAKVLFYASYSSATWSDARHNKIQEFCDSRGVEFIDAEDYRTEIGFDDYTDYYDMRDNGGGDHLNVQGAHKTTDFLANKLINDYGVTKTPNEEYDSKFDADIPYYHKLLEE